MSTLLCTDPATDRRFDRKLPLTIEWRGERYANIRENVTFIRLWGKFFSRHSAIPVSNIWGETYAHRPPGKLERDNVRVALRLLRAEWYIR